MTFIEPQASVVLNYHQIGTIAFEVVLEHMGASPCAIPINSTYRTLQYSPRQLWGAPLLIGLALILVVL